MAILIPPAAVAAQFLVDSGVGGYRTGYPRTEPAWIVSIGPLPSTPERVVAVRDSPSFREDGRQMNGETIVHPSVQIKIRGKYEIAYAKAGAIARVCDNCVREVVTVADVDYLLTSISRTADPVHLGNEEGNDLPVFALTMFLTVKEV